MAGIRRNRRVARALPSPECKMTRIPALFALSFLLLLTTSRVLTAETFDQHPRRHIRTTDRRLIRLVHDGVRASATFRKLVDRIRRSDVIVYLECGGARGSASGRLTFVSAVGGYRYVHVRVARQGSADAQIALIGHELQHAVEIADAPAVVDAFSLAREYQRIGFESPRPSSGMSFDSDAAVEAGYRVLRELSGTRSGQLPTPNLQLPSALY
jgi:hypothetical protein